ncbi:unnamed protein product [Moneuplotes crassus]|uniref:Uncharacterized protein n=1 Tax=Euplotes crassus TaxID=5936 RepID=A0AAD2DC82_EUPCR|nr:unnamed protein product [Moneuplotes crassus]
MEFCTTKPLLATEKSQRSFETYADYKISPDALLEIVETMNVNLTCDSSKLDDSNQSDHGIFTISQIPAFQTSSQYFTLSSPSQSPTYQTLCFPSPQNPLLHCTSPTRPLFIIGTQIYFPTQNPEICTKISMDCETQDFIKIEDIAHDAKEVIDTQKTDKGLLIACKVDLNANDNFIKKLLTCKRRREVPGVKIINLHLKQDNSSSKDKNWNEIFTMNNNAQEQMITLLPGIRDIQCIKYISEDTILIVPSGTQDIIQFACNQEGKLEKIKQFSPQIDKSFVISSMFYTNEAGIEETKDENIPEFLTLLSEDQDSIAVLDFENLEQNKLIADLEGFKFCCIEDGSRLLVIKTSTGPRPKIYLEEIEFPRDKERAINRIILEGKFSLAFKMADQLSDSSILEMIKLKEKWEKSEKHLEQIEALLLKIKDEEYILHQCLSNVVPQKNLLKHEALECLMVQKELVRVGFEILSTPKILDPNSGKILTELISKEDKISKYEIILEAFKEESKQEVIDWESYSYFTFMDSIYYLNAVCLSEGTKIENILIKLKELNLQEYYLYYYNILKAIDTSLVNDKFNKLILPQGKDTLEGTIVLKRGDLDLNYDPLPYQIIAKRIFLEEISPNKAFNLLLLGIQREINFLDYDAVSAFEISEIFKLNKLKKVISTTKEIKRLVNFKNSFQRFWYLIKHEHFLENYFNCIADIIAYTDNDRIYQDIYLQHLRSYIGQEEGIDFLRVLLSKMCSTTLFFEAEEGCDFVVSELYKITVKDLPKVLDLCSLLSKFVRINSISSRSDERIKWCKLCGIAEVLESYAITQTKTFGNLHEIVTLPYSDEKTAEVDKLISLIINEASTSSGETHGSYLQDDKLLMSLNDSLTLQRMIEGEERVSDCVKVYAEVVITQKKYDLIRAIQRQEDSDLYPMFEEQLLHRMQKEYFEKSLKFDNRIGEQSVKDMIENHRDLIQSLDSESKDSQSYLFFLKFVDLIREFFIDADKITCCFSLIEIYEMFKDDILVEELFNRTKKLDSFDDLIFELRNNVFIFTDYDKEYLIIKNAVSCLLNKWAKAVTNQEPDEYVSKLVSLIIKYNKQFFERHSDRADQMVEIILKIVNITDPNPRLWKRKKEFLRKSLVHLKNNEIVDSVSNVYVDMVCQEDENSTKDLINSYLQNQGSSISVFEEKMLCKICIYEEKDLHKINEGFYLVYQAVEIIKSENFENIQEEINRYVAIQEVLKVLQKCIFLCGDNKESQEEENKSAKLWNLVLCLRGKNKTLLEGSFPANFHEILEDIALKTNKLLHQVEDIVKEARAKLELSRQAEESKIEEESDEQSVIDLLVKAQGLEEMEELVQKEIKKYEADDDSLNKETFLQKYGGKATESINFYMLMAVVYEQHNPIMYQSLQELLTLMPKFYLPLYFCLNKSMFEGKKVPLLFYNTFITPYQNQQEEKALHACLKAYINGSILSRNEFLFFTEIINHLSDANIEQIQYTLEKLVILGFDEGLLYLGLLMKKILQSLKSVDQHETGQEFIDNCFKCLLLAYFKEKILISKIDCDKMLKEFLGSLVKISTDLLKLPEDLTSKVEEVQKTLEDIIL